MLEHEVNVFKRYNATGPTQSNRELHHPRSRQLYARTRYDELPIDTFLSEGHFGPSARWDIFQTLLDFEQKWMSFAPMASKSHPQRQSELLSPSTVDKMVTLWIEGYSGPDWLNWLLDKYEIHPSVAISLQLASIRSHPEAATTESIYSTDFLQEQNDSLLQRLEKLTAIDND